MPCEPLNESISNDTFSTNPETLFEFLPTKRGFKLASLNITSLPRHIDELRVLLVNCPVDVLSINETRLDSSVNDNEVYIPGYTIVRRDRAMSGRFGGGVCFYVRANINYLLRSDLNIDQLENLCIEIRKLRSRPFLVVTWYRPPNAAIEIFTYFESLVGKLDSENIEYYLMGDMNCNLASTILNNNATILNSIADIYGLQQLINDPTRCMEHSSTLIDLIFTNSPETVVCSGVSRISISDHFLVYAFRKVSISQPTNCHTTIFYRRFKNFNPTTFRNDIALQSWEDIYNYENPNDKWDAWKMLFMKCVDKHAPLQTRRIRRRKFPWITPQLKERLHERDLSKIKAIRSNNSNDWRNFKNLRDVVNNEITLAKEICYNDVLNTNNGDSRLTYHLANHK